LDFVQDGLFEGGDVGLLEVQLLAFFPALLRG